jgi:Predicted metal-dependent membrane protease
MKLFKNRYGEVRSGWSVTISMIIFLILSVIFFQGIVLGLVAVLIGEDFYNENLYAIANIASQGFMFLVAYLIYKVGYRRPVSQLGLTKEKGAGNFLGGILFGFIMFSAVVGGLVATGVLSFTGFNPGFYGQNDFYVAISTFSAGFGEEMLCRGLLTFQMKTTRSKLAILTVPSVIFSLLHLLNPGITVISLANIVIVGVLFGVLLMRTGSLWFCVGAHGIWNLAQGALYGIRVSGINSVGILVSELSGTPLLAGGEFGAEGSIITTAVLLIAIGLSCVLFKKPVSSGFSCEGYLPLVKMKKQA